MKDKGLYAQLVSFFNRELSLEHLFLQKINYSKYTKRYSIITLSKTRKNDDFVATVQIKLDYTVLA